MTSLLPDEDSKFVPILTAVSRAREYYHASCVCMRFGSTVLYDRHMSPIALPDGYPRVFSYNVKGRLPKILLDKLDVTKCRDMYELYRSMTMPVFTPGTRI